MSVRGEVKPDLEKGQAPFKVEPDNRPTRVVGIATLAMILAAATAGAQTATTIAEVVAAAIRQHPGPAEASAAVTAAAEGVNLARGAYLPRVDAMWQVTRATRNNVFGAFFPQFVVPISGPVLGTDSFESAWGSAVGLVFSAEVFDFGRRGTHVAETRALQAAADARAEAARLDAGVRAADLFLTVLGAERVVLAGRTNVDRLETLLRAVGALVDAQIRPGADRARVEADLAAARSRLYADEQARDIARVRLSVAIGQPTSTSALDGGTLLTATPGPRDAGAPPALGGAAPAAGTNPTPSDTSSAPAIDVTANPAVREGTASAQAASLARDTAALAYRPTLLVHGALSARGSGALLNGTIDNGTGLWPDVPNWVAGVQVTFPLFDLPATRARVAQRAAQVSAAEARKQAAEQTAIGAVREAQMMTDAARRIAGTTPLQLSAARSSATQARARYDAGLTGIVDVVDTERALARAEADASLATLALWRARLAVAAAAGDLAPFLAEVATPTGPPVGAGQ